MKDTRRTRILLALLLVASFTLITLDVRGGDSGPVAALRSGAAAVFGPLQRATSSAFSPVRRFFGGLGDDDRARLDELERENAAQREQLRTSEYARARAAELDGLLRTAGLGQYRVVPAQVIALGPTQGRAWTAQLDAGSRDGLAVGQTVINADGLVGRVTAVSAGTATVLLLVDPTFTAGARLAGTLEIAFVTGQGTDPLALQVLNPQAPVAPGDRVVTRRSATFAAGVPIGEVLSVRATPGAQSRVATLRPFADVTRLDLVGVIVEQPRTDPRDAVLPPRPATSPTPSPTPSPSPTVSPSASPAVSASRSGG